MWRLQTMRRCAVTLVVAILASCSRKEEAPKPGSEPEGKGTSGPEVPKNLVIKVAGMQRGEGGKT